MTKLKFNLPIYQAFRFLQRFIYLPLSVLWLGLSLASLSPVSAAADALGGIKGSVNFCGKGGVAGMMIYVPGRPYVLITDESGRFEFSQLSEGNYELAYSHQGTILNRNKEIHVSPGKTQLLGEIRFCLEHASQQASHLAPPDAGQNPVPAASATALLPADDVDKDGDGVKASQDCRDDNPAIRPGAREICDGLDNDCDGKIDNVELSTIEHGTATCSAGQLKLFQCDKGFSDCDGDIKNGCETDIMNDDHNCGGCGKFCGTEICSLGTC